MQIGPKAASRSKKRQKFSSRNFVPMSEINVTPFVDIMLVLLIIFMVTAPLLTVGVQVDLPESSADSLPEETEPLTLTINSKGEIEYSFVFSKGTIYMLTFANSEGNAADIEITLFDPSHKKIASNLIGGKYIPLGYKCMSTGVHYMTFKFKDGAPKCGLSILGFKRG